MNSCPKLKTFKHVLPLTLYSLNFQNNGRVEKTSVNLNDNKREKMTIHHFCKDRGVIVKPLIKASFIVVLLFRGMSEIPNFKIMAAKLLSRFLIFFI